MSRAIEQPLSASSRGGFESRVHSMPATPTRSVQLRELTVFLLLIVPSMLLSFFAVKTGALGFVTTAVATIGRDIGLVALVWLFLWRNGESMKSIGFDFSDRWRDVFLGGALYVVLASVANSLEALLHSAGLSNTSTHLPDFLKASGNTELALAIILVAVVAVAEEIIFRGYLIRRIASVTGSAGAAVILSSILFALGHGYEGTVGVITVGVTGFCFALIYLWRGSLVAPITMHFILDFISLVVAPLWRLHS